MAVYPSISPIKVYHQFKNLDSNEFQALVHFFEEHESVIKLLDIDHYFELLLFYLKALFETGAYAKHYDWVDELIELSIIHNIQYHKEEDVYQLMLFQKAASCYQLSRYTEAIYILKELLKINPTDKYYATFLKKCIRKDHPSFVKNSRAISVLLFLFSSIVIFIEVLLIRSFYQEFEANIEVFRNSLFVSAWVFLIGGDLLNRFKAKREVENFLSDLF